MLSYLDLFVQVYVVSEIPGFRIIDDLIREGKVVIAVRPGPLPSCSDSEILTITTVRHLLGRRGESGFLKEVRANWSDLFPRLPVQSEFNRRSRETQWGFAALALGSLGTHPPGANRAHPVRSLEPSRYERSTNQAFQPPSDGRSQLVRSKRPYPGLWKRRRARSGIPRESRGMVLRLPPCGFHRPGESSRSPLGDRSRRRQ